MASTSTYSSETVSQEPNKPLNMNKLRKRMIARRRNLLVKIASKTKIPYDEKIRQLCNEANPKKLLSTIQYLESKMKDSQTQIDLINTKISTLTDLRPKFQKWFDAKNKLNACEREYKNGKYTTAKNEVALVKEIGQLKAQMKKLDLGVWNNVYFSNERLIYDIEKNVGQKEKYERWIQSNLTNIKRLQEAQPLPTTTRLLPPPSGLSFAGFPIVITNLPQRASRRRLREIFGRDNNNQCVPILQLYITQPTLNSTQRAAYISYENNEMANKMVDLRNGHMLNRNKLKVERFDLKM